MHTHWTLTIDLRENRDVLVLQMALLSGDQQLHWINVQEVDPDMFVFLLDCIGTCFCDIQQPDRESLISRFGDMAGRFFALDRFLDQTRFSEADTLTINTIVTSIPWDLVHFKGHFLGHKLAVGLRIPTIRTALPWRRVYEKRPRFLHIVSNPSGDLKCIQEEVREIESLIGAKAPGLDYKLLDNPTPVEVISALTEPQVTPFVHYSGHVKPGEGLELEKRILKLDEIVRYFPHGGETVVFLNGCDAIYDLDAGVPRKRRGRSGTFDLFQLASVANAFLDAGASAVVAPRTRIADVDAYKAAIWIWTLMLEGENLGTAVGRYRRDKVREDPASLAGYSFILYGNPDMRIDRWIAPADSCSPKKIAQVDILNHPMIQEAWTDAGSPVAPQHIFGTLTRRWIIGQLYFSIDGQAYIETLERLRQELGIGSPPRPLASGPVQLSKVGSWLLERALARSGGAEPDDLAFLEAIAEVDDRHIELALEGLDIGPRNIAEFVDSARKWIADGRPVPRAVVNPDGYLNREMFLPGLGNPGQASNVEEPIDRWDLLIGLVVADSRFAKVWRREGLLDPPTPRWVAGQPAHWATLTVSAQEAIDEAMLALAEERGQAVTEGRLLICAVEGRALFWEELPDHARQWLSGQHVNQARWDGFMSHARIEMLSWI